MKLTVTTSKKIGLRGYGSQQYGASLEIELQHGTPDEVAATFKAAAADLRRLVEAEIARNREADAARSQPHNGNGQHNGNDSGHNGNGHAHPHDRADYGPRNGGSAGEAVVSPKQMKFIRGLSAKAKLRPSDLDARIRELFGNPSITLRDLTKRQASEVIDWLQETVAA